MPQNSKKKSYTITNLNLNIALIHEKDQIITYM